MCNDDLTSKVKAAALECGFARVGIAPANPLPYDDRFRAWIGAGYHADMAYLARHVEKRFYPAALVPGARSVICLAVSYCPVEEPAGDALIARYAQGRDYHKVLKRRAMKLCDRMRAMAGDFTGRIFVDAGPIAERTLAALAGLGWIGRNGLLIVPGLGSYVLLAEVVCNLPLCPDSPRPNGCGDCDACRAACPGGAIVSDATVDAHRCLSYQTIENRGSFPENFWEKSGQSVFGCDACQAACPHNRRKTPGDGELLAPPDQAPLTLAQILRWRQEDWDLATRGRVLRRATHAMFLRNAVLAAGNSQDKALLPALEALASATPPAAPAELLNWALGRIAFDDKARGDYKQADHKDLSEA
jgi:epoxyqueuosine reductase